MHQILRNIHVKSNVGVEEHKIIYDLSLTFVNWTIIKPYLSTASSGKTF